MAKSLKYCITCESYEMVYSSDFGDYHVKCDFFAGIDHPMELDWCEGPFATVEPPTMSEEEWDLTFDNAPDPNEMMLIDENNEHLVEC